MQRRKFSQDFKKKLIKEAHETGNASVVARKYDINPPKGIFANKLSLCIL